MPIDHHGSHFGVRGPLPLPPSEQGYPVIFQAGASGPGRDLAARTADAVFSAATVLADAKEFAADLRGRAAAYGRDPSSITVLPGLVASIGSTEAEAAARLERLDELSYRDLLQRAHRGETVRTLLRPQRPGHLAATGTPEQVADLIEHWHRAGAADGFTLMPDVIADGLPDFVDHVIPILQQRGMWPHDYQETSLRARLGLPMPGSAGR